MFPFYHCPVNMNILLGSLLALAIGLHLPFPHTEHTKIFTLKQMQFFPSLRLNTRTFRPFTFPF